jgi:hypothetical protein
MPNPYTLLSTAITGAVTAATTTPDILDMAFHRSLTVQFNFSYGSGGTSVDVYVQTTFDGGTTWTDIANFHATTSNELRLYNLNRATSVTSIATPTDGALSANTSVDGLLGDRVRVKFTTVGTYAGSTTLLVSAIVG